MKTFRHALTLFYFALLALVSTPCQAYGMSDMRTAQLMAQTSGDIMQAYDLLEQLKKRTEQFNEAMHESSRLGKLPRDLDVMRSSILKSRLIKVLSATPFSDPKKHFADCQSARTALQEYMSHLKKVLHAQQLPVAPQDKKIDISPDEQADYTASPDIDEEYKDDTEEIAADDDDRERSDEYEEDEMTSAPIEQDISQDISDDEQALETPTPLPLPGDDDVEQEESVSGDMPPPLPLETEKKAIL